MNGDGQMKETQFPFPFIHSFHHTKSEPINDRKERSGDRKNRVDAVEGNAWCESQRPASSLVSSLPVHSSLM